MINFSAFFKDCSKKSVSLFLLSLIVFFIQIFIEITIYLDSPCKGCEFSQPESRENLSTLIAFYAENFGILWILTGCGFVIATFPCFVRSFKTTNLLVTQIVVFAAGWFLFLIAALLYVNRANPNSAGAYTVVIGLFSVMGVCLGWIISTQLTRKYEDKKTETARNHHTKSHTINIMLKLNLSEDFRNHITKVKKNYPGVQVIPEEHAKWFFPRKIKTEQDNDGLTEEQYSAIMSFLFMMDLYEFICEGMAAGDIDKGMIYSQFFGMMLRTYTKGENVVNVSRAGIKEADIPPAPKAYIRVSEFLDEKRADYNTDCHNLTLNTVKK